MKMKKKIYIFFRCVIIVNVVSYTVYAQCLPFCSRTNEKKRKKKTFVGRYILCLSGFPQFYLLNRVKVVCYFTSVTLLFHTGLADVAHAISISPCFTFFDLFLANTQWPILFHKGLTEHSFKQTDKRNLNVLSCSTILSACKTREEDSLLTKEPSAFMSSYYVLFVFIHLSVNSEHYAFVFTTIPFCKEEISPPLDQYFWSVRLRYTWCYQVLENKSIYITTCCMCLNVCRHSF